MTDLGRIPGFDLLRGPGGADLALGDGCEDCCCNCTIRYLSTVPCSTCADIDYPASLMPVPQIKIAISGVTTGYNTPAPNYYDCASSLRFFSEPATGPGGAIYLTNPSCEVNAMGARTGFFNADFTLDPCTDVWLYDCRYICSSEYTGFFTFPYPNVDYFEWNVLNLTYQAGGSLGQWFITASLYSWVALIGNANPGTICSSVGSPFGGPPVNNNTQKILVSPGTFGILYRWLSYRRKQLSFELNAGTKTGYFYDPAYCDSGCNSDVSLARCLPSGLTSSFPTTTYNQTCPNEKALNVNDATATITVL